MIQYASGNSSLRRVVKPHGGGSREGTMSTDIAKGKRADRGLHPYVLYLRERYPDYGKWAEQQGVPVVSGHHLEDCRTEPLQPWPAKGGQGILINLSDQAVDDAYLIEIEPGGSLQPERHLYEELMFVVSGSGSAAVWNDDGQRVQFEWQPGSLFGMPINAHHQLFNGNGQKPARLLGVASAPLSLYLSRNLVLMFTCSFAFDDRFDGRADYFGRG